MAGRKNNTQNTKTRSTNANQNTKQYTISNGKEEQAL